MKFFTVLKSLSDEIAHSYDNELVAPGEVASSSKNIKMMYSPLLINQPLRLEKALTNEEVQITLVGRENSKKGWTELKGIIDIVNNFIKNKRWENLEIVKKSDAIKITFMSDEILPAILINIKVYYIQ